MPGAAASRWSWSGPLIESRGRSGTSSKCWTNLNHLGIEFVSFRENLDTGGPLGRAVVVIIGAVAELEQNMIIERVRAGMRRARLEGRHIGRRPLNIDRAAVLQERAHGQSLSQIAKSFQISRATVSRLIKQDQQQTHNQMLKRGAAGHPSSS
jgi:DNA invertase Pin-like site-specific DNA recombinase